MVSSHHVEVTGVGLGGQAPVLGQSGPLWPPTQGPCGLRPGWLAPCR